MQESTEADQQAKQLLGYTGAGSHYNMRKRKPHNVKRIHAIRLASCTYNYTFMLLEPFG